MANKNGTAKSAAGKADIRIEHNQCGKKHQDDGRNRSELIHKDTLF